MKQFKRVVWFGAGVLGKYLGRGVVPILTYHSIDDSGSNISTAPRVFQWQMRYLSDQGFRTISLGEYLERMAAGECLQGRAVVLTFDDAYRNVHETAFPVLERFGFTATVFVPTDYVGETSLWKMRPEIPRLPLMTWSELRRIKAHGFEIQSHSTSHPVMTKLTSEDVEREIVESKKAIESALGGTSDLFCFPYGDYDARVIDSLRAAGYRGAVSTEFGVNSRNADRFRLKRIGSAYCSEPLAFKACLWGMYAPLLRLRKGIGRLLPGRKARR